MQNSVVKILKVEHRAIAKNLLSTITITGDSASCRTYHKSMIPMQSRWRLVNNNSDIKKQLQEHGLKQFTNLYYRINCDGELTTRIIIRKNKNRASNLASLKKSAIRLKNYINANVTKENIHRVRFLTFTYKENMQDTTRLYYDLDKLLKRFSYHLATKENIHDYISIKAVEPQGRGAWHLHLLLILPRPIYFSHNVLNKLWTFGSSYAEKIENANNFGNYVASYLTDQKGKKFARLKFYPSNMKIVRYSRNIKKPIEYTDYHGANLDFLKNANFLESETKSKSIIIKSTTTTKDNKTLETMNTAKFERQFDYENYFKKY